MDIGEVIILAGGLGTRLREETEFVPKPMVKVGDKPVLWHIMKNLSNQGLHHYIIATGYKSDVIKDYFVNYETRNNDFTISQKHSRNSLTFHEKQPESSWSVTVSFTGEYTNTGGRIKKVSKYLTKNKPFMVAYGDGLADIDLKSLYNFHKSHGKWATVTTVRPISRFGLLEIDSSGRVKNFKEKPIVDNWVSIGFFIFETKCLDLFDLNSILEVEVLEKLCSLNQLMAYRHPGFWQPMDTYREFKLLNSLWDTKEAPWKNWN